MPGPIFGKYDIVKRIAIGGMGEVFLAKQALVAGFERLVILKSLLPELAQQQESVDQFLDEARVAATLNHPNVVSIFEVGLWEGTYYIAMEYLDGTSFSGMRRAARAVGAQIPYPIIAKLIHDAALGLDHAHQARNLAGVPLNIVHRDVSPQNLMVRRDGVTKVLDFGIARVADRSGRTRTGQVKGKLAYMAPEQFMGQPVDGRSDQFALGVILWELLTEKRLFAGSEEEVMLRLLKAPIVPPSRENPEVPPELESVAMRMLDRTPQSRFATCAEVAAHLEQYLRARAPNVGTAQVGQFINGLLDDAKSQESVSGGEARNNFIIELRKESEASLLAQASPVTPSGRSPLSSPSARPPTLPTAQVKTPPPPPAEALIDIEEAPPEPAPRRKGVWIGAAVAGLVVIAGAGIVLSRSGRSRPAEPAVAAPVQAPPPVDAPKAEAPKAEAPKSEPPKPAESAPVVQVPPPAPSPAQLRVVTEPAGAEVVIDGEPRGATPLETAALAPGVKHAVEIRLPGYRIEHPSVELAPGQSKELFLSLTRERRIGRLSSGDASKALPGMLTLNTEPWTQVEIDGEPYGSTPLFKKRLSPGRHTLVMTNAPAGIHVSRTVDIAPNQVTKLQLALGKH